MCKNRVVGNWRRPPFLSAPHMVPHRGHNERTLPHWMQSPPTAAASTYRVIGARGWPSMLPSYDSSSASHQAFAVARRLLQGRTRSSSVLAVLISQTQCQRRPTLSTRKTSRRMDSRAIVSLPRHDSERGRDCCFAAHQRRQKRGSKVIGPQGRESGCHSHVAVVQFTDNRNRNQGGASVRG